MTSTYLLCRPSSYRIVHFSAEFKIFICYQCSAEKFHNWGQCPRALEKVGTFEKKVGTLWGK